jgi:hypothetical protein
MIEAGCQGAGITVREREWLVVCAGSELLSTARQRTVKPPALTVRSLRSEGRTQREIDRVFQRG